ncbi:hypothetical protein LshimejAT787_0407530 [Lyophyllum shimeji]|uniref:Uncharacterized protein n=1 Tax=Lyophyllum shimeji TaxID=47721 RepID=A0A9P3PK44_LYOSH|nr:hypothetical protein LshimejAT787_0407530 [Lyophyllum shimeji]
MLRVPHLFLYLHRTSAPTSFFQLPLELGPPCFKGLSTVMGGGASQRNQVRTRPSSGVTGAAVHLGYHEHSQITRTAPVGHPVRFKGFCSRRH